MSDQDQTLRARAAACISPDVRGAVRVGLGLVRGADALEGLENAIMGAMQPPAVDGWDVDSLAAEPRELYDGVETALDAAVRGASNDTMELLARFCEAIHGSPPTMKELAAMFRSMVDGPVDGVMDQVPPVAPALRADPEDDYADRAMMVNGERCRYSERGMKECNRDRPQRSGTFVGLNRHGRAKVQWDGYKTVSTYLPAYIETLPMTLPPKFLLIHTDAMFQAYLEHGQIVRVMPREPLGEALCLDGAVANETVTLVTVRGINKGGVVQFEAASAGDLAAAEAWAEKHKETTREEFDWLPALGGDGEDAK